MFDVEDERGYRGVDGEAVEREGYVFCGLLEGAVYCAHGEGLRAKSVVLG